MKQDYSSSDTMKMLNAILDVPKELHGKDYLQKIARNIWDICQFEFVIMGHAVGEKNEKVRTSVALVHGKLIDNFTYNLEHTPCENVFSGQRVCIHKQNVAELFPEDAMLIDMGVQSYIGAPTIVNGRLFGLIALLDSNRIINEEHFRAFIEFIASRTSIELERYINQKELEELTKRAKLDPLTGIFNRNEFEQSAKNLLQRYANSNYAIIFIDADNFKSINDTYGHQKGDDVLCMLAEKLQLSIRNGDILARYGGEEFIAILANVDIAITEEVTSRMHKNINENTVHPVTVSIGVSIGKPHEQLSVVISRADAAMYQAKNNGKNQTCFINNKQNFAYSSDRINPEKFMPHGRVEITLIDQHIVFYRAEGPFNQELMTAISEMESIALADFHKADKQWVKVVLFRNSCAAEPAFLADLSTYIKHVTQNNIAPLANAFIIPRNIEGAEKMPELFAQCYKDSGVNFKVFTQEIDALEWVNSIYNQHQH
ncbi:sensor domain-containing diguanylate cyclase [Litorilituus lipolyticus]|uniref:diguanylate cyclase n=1 Tax=Litorilituus lipolyticus TaxID=2491017 RepID=A0A502KVB6_9GAMM|nr:sensor domain-containing diguanylate cyclase [Litorilituus lipolyticus]TPH15608.1 sensor domain-containing diguanylate cyclase [Litorilituus lipolyticus]